MYFGIDGGQTKTVGVILSDKGTILAKRTISGMPYNGELHQKCLSELNQLVSSLCDEAHITRESIQHLCGGLCGIDNEKQAIDKRILISKALQLPAQKISLVNDAIIALWAGSKKQSAILLQHGTAFTSAIRKSSNESLLFDSTDIGRIFDIRQELLVLVARMIDGRKKSTSLKDETLSFFNIDDEKEFGFAIDYEVVPLEKQRATVDLIFHSWLNGDLGASELIEKAAEEYGAMITIMLRNCDRDSVDVIMGGGLLNRAPDSFFPLCQRYIRTEKKIQLCRPVLEPVLGAGLYAMAQEGQSTDKAFQKLTRISYK